MPHTPDLTKFITSSGSSLASLNLGWITKEYLMSVYPQIANQLITPELWTWGNNGSGQVGDNTTIARSTPVTTFVGGTNWKQVSSGAAIKTDGTLWVWGSNCGDNTSITRSTPVTTFAGGTNWKQVSGRAAIKTDGTLWLWGDNTSGQLGDNTTIARSTPVTTFAGGNNWKYVETGNSQTYAIKTDGTLWCWGAMGAVSTNPLPLNEPGSSVNRSTPVTSISGGTNWKQVSKGNFHTMAIKTDGTLWGWGRQQSLGELGINGATGSVLSPRTTFAGGTNWKQVACGSNHSAAIKTDGTLWIWGGSSSGTHSGQVGDNTSITRSTPVTTFAGGTSWKQVACMGLSTAAIKTDGTLWIWGHNASGQLGDNTTTNRSTPVTTFAGGTNWKQVAVASIGSGSAHTAAIKTSDDLQGI